MVGVRLNRQDVRNRIQWFLELKPCDFRRKLIKHYLRELRKYSMVSRSNIRLKYNPLNQANETVRVLTQFAGGSLDVVRKSIQDLGLTEVLDTAERYEIIWCGTSDIPKIDLIDRFVNKFPGAARVLSKISLFRGLELYRRLLPISYDFYPRTWFLPFQMRSLLHDLNTTNYKPPPSSEKSTYIVKPDNGTQGRGIYLFQSANPYTRQNLGPTEVDGRHSHILSSTCANASVGSFTTELRNQNLNYLQPALDVVQRYEISPTLLFGYKTDLRVYAVIETLVPLKIHIYRDGLVRLASRTYHTPDRSNLCQHTMHLTNYAINKLQHPLEGAAPVKRQTAGNAAETNNNSQSVTACNSDSSKWHCKYSLSDLIRPKAPWSHIDWEALWSRVDDIVRHTIFTLVPELKVSYWAEYGNPLGIKDTAKSHPLISENASTFKGPNCFQILGFDFLLVEPGSHPVLLEVNSNPSLRTDSVQHLLRRVSPQSSDAEYEIVELNRDLAAKCFTHGLVPFGPLAEVATVLSSVMGDRYAHFERSAVDEKVKGGLIRSTIQLISRKIVARYTDPLEPEAASMLHTPGLYNGGYGIQLPMLDSSKSKTSNTPSSPTVKGLQHSAFSRSMLPTGASRSSGNPGSLVTNSICRRNRFSASEKSAVEAEQGKLACSPSDQSNLLETNNLVSEHEKCTDTTESAPLDCIYFEGERTSHMTHSYPDSINMECQRLLSRLHELKGSTGSLRKHTSFLDALNLDAFDSAPRIFDLLADMFLSVLSSRKPRLKPMSPPKVNDQVTDDWTTATGLELGSIPPTKSRYIPRMDLTAFRTFCRTVLPQGTEFSGVCGAVCTTC